MTIESMTPTTLPNHFIRSTIDQDLASGKHTQIITRFPPEPNGYLHIGHAKSICLNFGLAQDYQGFCHLRMDDTNPEKESHEYAQSIQEDVRWLGFEWQGEVRYASDYFEQLYAFAEYFIQQDLAFVDELSAEEMRAYRGNLQQAGKNSPYRSRSIAENLDLFRRMRAGEFADGSRVLRLKIDMASPNMNLRDPVIYRIRRSHHIRTGDTWCIYPMYDYTHCISDAIEAITHSLCTLEFADHRPLYDWVLSHLPMLPHPQQIEFSRLELLYSVTSKRKLNQLVQDGLVSGWNDPRMPTISGMRRRGYPPAALREFAKRIGISKSDNVIDLSVLEGCVREELEATAPRLMVVLNPIKVVITNFAGANSRQADFHPQQADLGNREVHLSDTIYIEQDDFAENPPKGFHRLTLGSEVRLRHSYILKCDEIIKNAEGEIIELRASIDHATLGKNPEGRKVKGVIHWVSVAHAVRIEARLYERLFTHARPDMQKDAEGNDIDFKGFLNPNSLRIVTAYAESAIAHHPNSMWQFERLGYFCSDAYETSPEKRVFNRTVSLKDSWVA